MQRGRREAPITSRASLPFWRQANADMSARATRRWFCPFPSMRPFSDSGNICQNPGNRHRHSRVVFASYCHDVNLRLAPHQFRPRPQLRKDPQKQTRWTDWLEYLNFELRCLEVLTAAADSSEPKYYECMRLLQKGRQRCGNNAVSNSVPPDIVQAQKGSLSGKSVDVVKDLASLAARVAAASAVFIPQSPRTPPVTTIA